MSIESPVAGRDERPRSSAVGDGACLRMGQSRMAEATPSGREGLLAGMIRLGEEKRAAHWDGSPYLGAGISMHMLKSPGGWVF